MDREIAYALIAAVAGMAIIGNFMLGPQSSAPAQHATYAPEDIRHKLQQSEAKKNRKPKAQTPAPEQLAPKGATRSGGGDTDPDPSDEPQEEPEAEEPPLD